MRIKNETLAKYRVIVDEFIRQGKYKESLEISSKYPIGKHHTKTYVICKSRLLSQYLIQSKDLDSLSSVIKPNPHFKSSPPMVLFSEDEVKLKFKLKPKYV